MHKRFRFSHTCWLVHSVLAICKYPRCSGSLGSVIFDVRIYFDPEQRGTTKPNSILSYMIQMSLSRECHIECLHERVAAMPIYPKRAALLSPGRNWEVVDRPPLSSVKIFSVYQLCDASLLEDPECTIEELGDGLDWHFRALQAKIWTLDMDRSFLFKNYFNTGLVIRNPNT